jgi:hypothetical protein
MNCDEYQDQFSSYINKELNGEQRILTKNHLKKCKDCRENYLSLVKMHYVIDREEILITDPESESKSFKNEVLERVEQYSETKRMNHRWLWYAAAAILICGIVIGRFVIPENGNQNFASGRENETLSQLIFSEDWNRLGIVLSDQDEFTKFSTDVIPIHILLEKLLALQKMGVQSVPIVSRDKQYQIEQSDINKHEPRVEISLNDFIQLLEQAKLQRSQITLQEVSNMLTTNKRGAL